MEPDMYEGKRDLLCITLQWASYYVCYLAIQGTSMSGQHGQVVHHDKRDQLNDKVKETNELSRQHGLVVCHGKRDHSYVMVRD